MEINTEYNAVTSVNNIRADRVRNEIKVDESKTAQGFYEKVADDQKEVTERKEAIMAEVKRMQEQHEQNQKNQQYEQTGRLLG